MDRFLPLCMLLLHTAPLAHAFSDHALQSNAAVFSAALLSLALIPLLVRTLLHEGGYIRTTRVLPLPRWPTPLMSLYLDAASRQDIRVPRFVHPAAAGNPVAWRVRCHTTLICILSLGLPYLLTFRNVFWRRR